MEALKNMLGKKALRLATAALMVGVAMGAQQVIPRHASAAGETGVVAITDWQPPDGCGVGSSSVADTEVCTPMMDGLFTVDNHLNYIPDLNSDVPTQQNGEVKIVNGNMVVTFKLKPNLKYSDGTPLTVQDIIFDTKLEIAVGNSTGIDQITNMKAIDDRTLQVTYNGLYAPYIGFAPPATNPIVSQAYLEKKYGTSDFNTIVSKFSNDLYNSPSDEWSGPFKLQSFSNGNIVEVPNPNYNALPPDSSHPRYAQFKFVTVSNDESSLAAALGSPNAGVNQAEDFQPSDLPLLYASKYHITVQPALFYEHLELNQNGPLKDIRLRQALQYAVNKVSLVHQLFPQVKDPASLVMRTPVPLASPWADNSVPISEYNVAKAKALLKSAGYSTDYNGPGKHLYLKFATTGATVRQKDFQILSKFWANVGVHVSPYFTTPFGINGLFSNYSQNGILYQRRFDIALFAFQVPPDPQSAESSFNPSLIPSAAVHGGGDQNYPGVTDQDQYNLLVQARHALDSTQRHALFNKWQQLASSRVYWLMLYARTNITANDGTVGNYLSNPSSAGNEWNAFQWYAKQ